MFVYIYRERGGEWGHRYKILRYTDKRIKKIKKRRRSRCKSEFKSISHGANALGNNMNPTILSQNSMADWAL